MRVGIVGCGYVFDHYMATWVRHPNLELVGIFDRDRARMSTVCAAYGLASFSSLAEMLSDSRIELVVNLTSVESHYEVTRACLEAGKHVYCEKPLTRDLGQCRELFDLSRRTGLELSVAPSNVLGDSAQSLWRAVSDGAIGQVRIVYAEFDDNPIYLMGPETWRSRTGAPWPYIGEYQEGCTHEHVGYHLTLLCAVLGPVRSVTAFSKQAIPVKTRARLDPADTPDFSVACLDFHSGAVARVTCSIGAPLDHRVRFMGDQGALTVDTYRHYRCPVYLETYTPLTLNARKAMSVRRSSVLQKAFGVGGQRLRLVKNAVPGESSAPSTIPRSIGELRRVVKDYQLGRQDKCLGIAELADAISTGRIHFPTADFSLHIAELTLAIQASGTGGPPYLTTTTFDAQSPRVGTLGTTMSFRPSRRIEVMSSAAGGLLQRLHRH